MNLRLRRTIASPTPDVLADLTRIRAIWRGLLSQARGRRVPVRPIRHCRRDVRPGRREVPHLRRRSGRTGGGVRRRGLAPPRRRPVGRRRKSGGAARSRGTTAREPAAGDRSSRALALSARGRRRIASSDRSTSSSVVAHELTLIRIAVSPCQTVGPHQQVPSAWSAAITRRVRSASPNETSTWFSTTSFSTRCPAARSPSAKRRAWRQQRSTSSASPARPSARSAAHTSTPRARRESSGVKSAGSRRAPCGR